MHRSSDIGQTPPPNLAQACQTPPDLPPLVLLSSETPHEIGLTPPGSPPGEISLPNLNAVLAEGACNAAEASFPLEGRRPTADAQPKAAASHAGTFALTGQAAHNTNSAAIEQSMQDLSVRYAPGTNPFTPRALPAPDQAERSAAHPAPTELPAGNIGAKIQSDLDAYDAHLSRIRPMLTSLERMILDNPDKTDKELARIHGVSDQSLWEKRQAFLRCGLVTPSAYGGAQESNEAAYQMIRKSPRQLIREEFKAHPWIQPKDVARKLNVSYTQVQSERRIMERTEQFQWALGLTINPPTLPSSSRSSGGNSASQPQRPPLQVWTFTRQDGTLVTVRPEDRQEVLDRLRPGVTTNELLDPLERRYGPVGYKTLNRWLGL